MKSRLLPLFSLGLLTLACQSEEEPSAEGSAAEDVQTSEEFTPSTSPSDIKEGMTIEEVEAALGRRGEQGLPSNRRVRRVSADWIDELADAALESSESSQASISLQIAGDSGPMNDRLAEDNQKYGAASIAWRQQTAGFDASRKRAFLDIAQAYRQESRWYTEEAQRTSDAAAQNRAQLQAAGYAARADAFKLQASLPYEDKHWAMLTADTAGEIMDGSPDRGCRLRPSKTRSGEKVMDCPLVDLHEGLAQTQMFTTIDRQGRVQPAKKSAYQYQQTLHAKVVRHHNPQYAGSKGSYFDIAKALVVARLRQL